ncbi:MAG TPA: ATP synthase subunit I [Hanamia sp.]|nr:ATP synthase subunit I [Hanamia sp.]
MNETVFLLPSLLAGIILGVIFFGGLWVTIQKGLRSKRTALIFAGSFIVRIAIILLGFYYVGQSSWQNMLVCLAGFLIARIMVTRFTQKKYHSENSLRKEVRHET